MNRYWKNSSFDSTSTTNIHPNEALPEKICGRMVLLLHPPKNYDTL
ncbi:MAG: hypothetical protein F6K08_34255 [Okeania sp. SIO1H6]|nr:hypothetical protein [Okeania sp. SIO1H6]